MWNSICRLYRKNELKKWKVTIIQTYYVRNNASMQEYCIFNSIKLVYVVWKIILYGLYHWKIMCRYLYYYYNLVFVRIMKPKCFIINIIWYVFLYKTVFFVINTTTAVHFTTVLHISYMGTDDGLVYPSTFGLNVYFLYARDAGWNEYPRINTITIRTYRPKILADFQANLSATVPFVERTFCTLSAITRKKKNK